jgi:L-fucose mutarotase
VTVDDVLAPLLTAVPIESVTAMLPDEGTRPECRRGYEQLPGPGLPLRPVERLEFYRTCREPEVAVCVATGDDRLYANLLLTVGFLRR